MKIKEVCALTGLTERTVRFYEEKGLCSPKKTFSNGREFREYTVVDVDTLRTVATLRKMLFSIDDILQMQRNPEQIGSIISVYLENMRREKEQRADILYIFQSQDMSAAQSARELARMLSEPARARRLPREDAEPDFTKFEPEPAETKEEQYRRFLHGQERRYRRGRALIVAIVAINLLSGIVNLALQSGSVVSLILQVVFGVALLVGQTWARVLFIIGSALSASMGVYLLFAVPEAFTAGSAVAMGLAVAWSVFSAVVLIHSESVKEYLYTQKNG